VNCKRFPAHVLFSANLFLSKSKLLLKEIHHVNILAIDTSDARGSVAARTNGQSAQVLQHQSTEDYSSWLLPAVDILLSNVGTSLADTSVLAVSTGPGSFTGLRAGLTAVKAWAEVYGSSVVGISRLEAMASRIAIDGLIASCYDAQRGHVFGGIYDRAGSSFKLLEREMVTSPDEFLALVTNVASTRSTKSVSWISLDPELITALPAWKTRHDVGDTMLQSGGDIARSILELGAQRAAANSFTDPLLLDANYVRRSDAEIFWKDPRS
jgi:tRNA threonylcarbamoyladenosine biosynthesis protein TsaB